jgi:glycosyltransferase involved in cell wall biosynthesis
MARDVLSYPFKHFHSIKNRAIWDRLQTWYETFRITSREKRKKILVPMSQLNNGLPLSDGDIPLVFISHNDIHLLGKFLAHYRKLGVTRFICVDDASKDGTLEFLLKETDIDVWTSPVRYSDARRGRRWREQLFAHNGINRWYLNVDSDEFLVYDHSDTTPLTKLIATLEAADEKRLAAPMLDMYSGQSDTFADDGNAMPWEFSRYFDGAGYSMTLNKRGISLKGGPRTRKFEEKVELIKYPLVYWDNTCFFGSSPHRPLPYERNFTTIWGALLHFKFYVNYREKIVEAAVEQQHYGGSVHYKKMMNEIDEKGEIDLHDEVSIEFTGPDQLVNLGFMSRIDWDKSKG